MRLVRGADREAAEPPRRRRGDGQLRRPSRRRCRAPARRRRGARRRGRGGRVRRPRRVRRHRRTGRGGDESLAVAARAGCVVAAVLTVPVALLAMVPPLGFDGWEWVALALATPVVFYAGSASTARRCAERTAPRGDDGHADLARDARRVDVVDSSSSSRGLDADTYFEVAAVVTTLILLGRYLEARAKRRSSAAIRRAARARREGGTRAPRRRRGARAGRGARASATSSSSGRARRSRPTASSSRGSRRSTGRC